jgi:hypothetical protein
MASVALAACGTSVARSTSNESTASKASTETGATPPTTDEYGSSPGTPAAWASAAQLVTVPAGSRDCGQEYPSSGFPTTAAPFPGHFDCIVAAAQAGEPARYALLSRDHHGGVAITLYDVLGPAQVRIVSQVVDWTGAPGSVSDQQCTALQTTDRWADPTCVS